MIYRHSGSGALMAALWGDPSASVPLFLLRGLEPLVLLLPKLRLRAPARSKANHG